MAVGHCKGAAHRRRLRALHHGIDRRFLGVRAGDGQSDVHIIAGAYLQPCAGRFGRQSNIKCHHSDDEIYRKCFECFIKDPPLILRSWFPFDVHDQRLMFVAYAIQFCVMWMGILIVPSWNTLMVVLMTNAIIALRQLNWQLEHPEVEQLQIRGYMFQTIKYLV